jgi:hypothetical protein
MLQRMKRILRESGMGKIASGISLVVRSAAGLDADRAVVGCLRIAYGAGQCARMLGLKYQIYR